MLLRCCLIQITIIILRHILNLVYLCTCLNLGIFMSYLCNLFFIFNLIFIIINHITSFKQTYLVFVHVFLEYLLIFLNYNVGEESKWFSNSKSSVSGCCLAVACLIFCQFQLGVTYKKACIFCLCHVTFNWRNSFENIQKLWHVKTNWVLESVTYLSIKNVKGLSLSYFTDITSGECHQFLFLILSNCYQNN